MIDTLTSNPIVLSLVAALVGASPYIYLSLAGRLMTLPALSKIKKSYPAINTYVRIASDVIPDDTLLGMVADAAYAFWSGQGLSEKDAKAHTAAAMKYWSERKFALTEFTQLPADAIAQGEAIARKLLPPGTNVDAKV